MIACCMDPENRVEMPSGKPDLKLEVCKECGRRHFELTVDPGELGVSGARLG